MTASPPAAWPPAVPSPEADRAAIAAHVAAFPSVRLPGAGLKPASVALCVVYQDDVPCLLITRRAPTLRSHAGQWALPGGRRDEGESIEEAARRELLEETGWGDVPVSAEEVAVNSNVQWSNLNGTPTLCLQHDHYFVGHVPGRERPLGDVAAMHTSDGIVHHRWWTLAELDTTEEDVYPPGLADMVRRYFPASS